MTEGHVDRIREQFTRQAEAYARMRQASDEASLALLVALAEPSPAAHVVDVACGPGFLTLAFAARCARATGIDATDAFLALARAEAARRGLANVEFVAGDVNQLHLTDASVDLVSCRAAFHHFPEPARVLAEMRRVAKPGGTLLVADLLGSEDPAQAARHDEIERLCDPTHVRALPLSEFERLFRQAGLEVVHRPTTALHYDVEEWLAHGGPGSETAAVIRRLFEASLDGDSTGLRVRRENGRLRFTHAAAAFVLRR
jgi:ubiquinone/menaquinone biosynthesis C-methylase UbiE